MGALVVCLDQNRVVTHTFNEEQEKLLPLGTSTARQLSSFLVSSIWEGETRAEWKEKTKTCPTGDGHRLRFNNLTTVFQSHFTC